MTPPARTGLLRKGLSLLGLGLAVTMLTFAMMVGWHGFRPASSTLMQMRYVLGDPVDRRWRDLEFISPYLARAVIASEDQRFCNHGGVDWGELHTVLNEDGGPSRGASTLTMQTVKNLYLWPGRSYLRKMLEIPMALIVDLFWPKSRIMEVYLNIAEWGEGIFGAEAAAQRFFGKSSRDLTVAESARLAAALPNPRVSDPRYPNSASRRIALRMGAIEGLAGCLE